AAIGHSRDSSRTPPGAGDAPNHQAEPFLGVFLQRRLCAARRSGFPQSGDLRAGDGSVRFGCYRQRAAAATLERIRNQNVALNPGSFAESPKIPATTDTSSV